MQSVFLYDDYRKFLLSFYQQGKKTVLTYRSIAAGVGFKSAGHFTQIINGQTDISADLALKFADFMGLKPREKSYFTALVEYNQASDTQNKKRLFERLIAFKKSTIKIVNPDQYEFYNKWYHAAIREIFDIIDFDDNYAMLANQLVPPITIAQARKSVLLLQRLGLIQKNENGLFRKTDQVISTGNEASSESVNNFAIASMDLAKLALEKTERTTRNISWMTLTVSPRSYEKIQEELREFRRRALEIAKNDLSPDQVYQFNFQVFPMSKRIKKDGVA